MSSTEVPIHQTTSRRRHRRPGSEGDSVSGSTSGADAVTKRVQRLSKASANRVIDPDVEITGHVGPGQILPDELLSVADLDLDLTPEQRATLSREEVASIVEAGVMFEAVLEAGLALEVTRSPDLTDPRVTYLLHEIGEETRHQRLFIRMLTDLEPKAPKPMNKPLVRMLERLGTSLFIQRPAMLYTLILGGEEIPDLFQKKAAEHPDTDDFVRTVNRYHRQEEARHLSFARSVLPEVWSRSGWFDRLLVRRVAPQVIRGMFDFIVQPGVYETIGLPAWPTWKAARQSPSRIRLRHEATRSVLKAQIEAGTMKSGRINRQWQDLCGVDRHGDPVPVPA